MNSWALETYLEKKYYDVSPTSLETLYEEILQAASLTGIEGHHYLTIGGYEASTEIKRMNLIYDEKTQTCKPQYFEMNLNGNMTLPRLKMGTYPLKIRQSFEQEKVYIEEHEKEHESLWQQGLQAFEKKIQGLVISDNESCTSLIDEINQEMVRTLDEILQKNVSFDCLIYGERLEISQCELL